LKMILVSVELGEGRYQLLCANHNWIKKYEQQPLIEESPLLTPEERSAIATRVTTESWTRLDVREARTIGVLTAWQAKTAEELAAHGAKVSAGKIAAGNQGNIENLAKGWAVRDKAIAASADARRGTHETEEHREAIGEGLKRAYAEGRRKRGHSEETKQKIRDTKAKKAKLTEQDIVKIKEMRATGMSQAVIGKAFNVSAETVARAIRGHR
jgi:DNA-binding transcriptional regulator YiaG